MERRLSTVEARKSFSQLVNATHFKGDHVIIERHGTPMVVLLSIDEYQRLMAAFIVSGDPHLLNLKEYHGTRIVTPRQFVSLLP